MVPITTTKAAAKPGFGQSRPAGGEIRREFNGLLFQIGTFGGEVGYHSTPERPHSAGAIRPTRISRAT